MRIALLQCEPPRVDSSEDVLEQRLLMLEQNAAAAKSADANLLLVPEAYLSGYHIGLAATRERALAPDAVALRRISTLAKRHHIAIAFGYIGCQQHHGDNHALTNRARLIGDDGRVVLDYQKSHMFGDTDRSRFSPGKTLSAMVVIADVRVALAICYDIEFPEVARSLALSQVELILVPTANMAPYDSVPMRIVPTRAEENGVFIAYANYCGPEREFDYTGLSCVCGPDGHDLARAGREPTLIFADIDTAHIHPVREGVNYLADRRVNLYRDR